MEFIITERCFLICFLDYSMCSTEGGDNIYQKQKCSGGVSTMEEEIIFNIT